MVRYFFILLLLLVSCKQAEKRKAVSLPKAIYESSLDSDRELISTNVLFSERGAHFDNEWAKSYIKIDSIKFNSTKEVNISLWFNFSSEDPGIPKSIFSVSDTTQLHNKLNIWVAGDRITGEFNSNYLWAKEYDFKNGISKYFFDLFRLEGGKYYFLSINLINNVLEIYVNAELYSKHIFDNDFHINFHHIYLGVKQYRQERFDGEFIGYLKDISIFDKALSKDEIYSLSVKSYKNVHYFNEAYELSKFDFEKYEN